MAAKHIKLQTLQFTGVFLVCGISAVQEIGGRSLRLSIKFLKVLVRIEVFRNFCGGSPKRPGLAGRSYNYVGPTCQIRYVAYNSNVPTPFYHLSVAEDLLVHPRLSAGMRRFLQEHRPAFLLGNTAPDVQTISGQPRRETHFFELPLHKGMATAWDQLLEEHPSLAASNGVQQSHMAFMAGYLCHLQADWMWVGEIYEPIFGPDCRWEIFKQRLYLHNVLRSYLDQQILPVLPARIDVDLGKATPAGWLPFVQDNHLVCWRDFLAHQLHPGSSVKTVEVFAARQSIPPENYYRLLSSDRLMDEMIFRRISLADLKDYRQRLLKENIRLLRGYLVS
jgi:hypothetical protein